MCWREEISEETSFNYLSSEDVSNLIDNKDFEISQGVNSRYLNSDCDNALDDDEITLHATLISKTDDTLRYYVRVTISDELGLLEYESAYGSYEGDEIHNFDSESSVDSFLDDLFKEYE